MSAEKIKVTLVRSTNKKLENHKSCVRGLGLRRIGHTVELINTPEVRGIINRISYLLKVEGL